MPDSRVLDLAVMLNPKYFSMTNSDPKNLGKTNMFNFTNKK